VTTGSKTGRGHGDLVRSFFASNGLNAEHAEGHRENAENNSNEETADGRRCTQRTKEKDSDGETADARR